MKKRSVRSAILLMTLSLALPAAAETAGATAAPPRVAVSFTDPERFTDATYQNRASTRDEVTRDLAQYLVERGSRDLPEGQRLEIEVRDIDLAGRYEPWRTQGHDVRYLRDVDWPSVRFAWRRYEGERLVAQGEERLSDMNYLSRAGARADSDRLRYEKRMLDDWFRKQFRSRR